MRNANSILTLGIILILMPMLGFPSAWKNFFLGIAGVYLCFTVFSARGFKIGRKRVDQPKSQGSVAPVSVVGNNMVGNEISSEKHLQSDEQKSQS